MTLDDWQLFIADLQHRASTTVADLNVREFADGSVELDSAGTALFFTAPEWTAFLSDVRQDRFTLTAIG
ncbi:MAG: DUF397 domain-containing protein [Actinomycetota bacterium]